MFLCSGLFADPSLATLLQCFAVIAVSKHDADDELEAGAILTENPPTTPRRSTVFWRRYTGGLRGGPESSKFVAFSVEMSRRNRPRNSSYGVKIETSIFSELNKSSQVPMTRKKNLSCPRSGDGYWNFGFFRGFGGYGSRMNLGALN